MMEGRRILAVVPARGGSKGVPGKNIRPVLGTPLIAYTARVLRECAFVDRAVVSTDSPEIARVAEAEGLAAPFLRPAHLAGDRVGDWDVLVHALAEMEGQDRTAYDVVLMLQPTSPLRTPDRLREVLEKLLRENLDAVWTVSETDLKFHPLKQLHVGAGGKLEYYDPAGAAIVARQQLHPLYHRNGVAYALTRSCLLEQKKMLGDRSGAVVIREPVVNIDTLADFARLEDLLRRGEGGL